MLSRPITIMLALLLIAVAALGLYTYRLRRRAESHLQKASTPVPIRPSGPESRVTLALADDATASVQPASVPASLPAERTERARALLQLLLRAYQQPDSAHPLGLQLKTPSTTADVDAVFFLQDGTAVVDLSDSFAAGHPSGILIEDLTLDSITQTLHANFPEVRQVNFLVAGKPRDTLAGHADLSSAYPVDATKWFPQ